MTSYKISSTQSGPTKSDSLARNRGTTNSASSTISSVSSAASSNSNGYSLTSNSVKKALQNAVAQSSDVADYLDVSIIFPDGSEIKKSIDAKWVKKKNFSDWIFSFLHICFFFNFRKAIYDLLIELAAHAHLMPTNYTLKLYGNCDENGIAQQQQQQQQQTQRSSVDEDLVTSFRVIEYTPNQLVGQLSKPQLKFVFSFFTYCQKNGKSIQIKNIGDIKKKNNNRFAREMKRDLKDLYLSYLFTLIKLISEKKE